MLIDESTRFNSEFVRVKIACRDDNEVPESTEGTLGLFVYDFFFELESPDLQEGEAQKIGVKADDTCSTEPKILQKTDHTVCVLCDVGDKLGEKQPRGQYPCQTQLPSSWEKWKTYAADTKWVRPATDISRENVEGYEEEEVIPAATYEPTGSSEEYKAQVSRILGEDAE